MVNPDADNFDTGAISDRIDNRDYQWSEVAGASVPFDWQAGFDIETKLGLILPVKDQGPSFSCGGQAWSSYAGVLEAAATKSFEERSAKFFYAQTYQKGGGSTGRDNANIFIDEGATREMLLPSYESGNPPTEAFMTRGEDINETDRNDAKFDRGYSYAQVGTNIDDVAQAIRDNNGVVLGIDGSNNGTWLSPFPVPPKLADKPWRHWVYAGKAEMFNGVKHIGLLNSWGLEAGTKGWQWLSETYFKTHVAKLSENAVWSCWTHLFNVQAPVQGFKHNFLTDMKLGDSGVEVVALQTALQIDGEFPKTVPTSGIFGNITLAAVKAFQVKYSITPVAGYVGKVTRGKLNFLFND